MSRSFSGSSDVEQGGKPAIRARLGQEVHRTPSPGHPQVFARDVLRPAAQVRKALDGCDRKTVMGRRDYAILLLLAKLGLRAHEVATFTLDDIDWRASEILVRAKG
ncbi:hypothetical protein [Bradyrhizobium sp. 197]|uniref:hypothetical protein n=1 Tax=Bradyrhizobium sp. 197 TaxID=2782663 RepID=UPI001FF706E2|nr:hypothetical protein [Bradyrhizobium sp. 197]